LARCARDDLWSRWGTTTFIRGVVPWPNASRSTSHRDCARRCRRGTSW